MKPSYWIWNEKRNLLATYREFDGFCEITLLEDGWGGDGLVLRNSIFDLMFFGWIILGDVED